MPKVTSEKEKQSPKKPVKGGAGEAVPRNTWQPS